MLAAAVAADAAAAWIILWAYVDFKMLSLGLDIYINYMYYDYRKYVKEWEIFINTCN